MQTEELGGLTVQWAGGSDRRGGGDGPVVVLMHGFGAPGDDLVPIWRVVPTSPGVRWLFPRAPIELGGMFGPGRAWWKIDVGRWDRAVRTGTLDALADEVPRDLATASAAVESMLAALEERHGVTPDRLVLGGFSQGAMLACDVTLRRGAGRRPKGLVMLSGAPVAFGEWKSELARDPALSSVLMSHGTVDPILPFAMAEKLRDAFVAAKIPTEFIPFHDGHTIAPVVYERLGDFVTARFSDV